MKAAKQSGDTLDLVEAARAVQEAQHSLGEAEGRHMAAYDAMTECERKLEQAKARLRHVMLENGLANDLFPSEQVATPRKITLDDREVAICWRVAFLLLENPVLDYQSTAAALWGPKLDKRTAKNRVNAHLTQLKRLGVIKALGSNRYQVDRERLAEQSGLRVHEEAAMT